MCFKLNSCLRRWTKHLHTHTHSLSVFMYFFLPHPLFKPHAPLPAHLRVTYVNFSAELLTAREKHIFIIQRRPHYATYRSPPHSPLGNDYEPARMCELCKDARTQGRNLRLSCECISSQRDRGTVVSHADAHGHEERRAHTHTQQGAHCLDVKLVFSL